MFKIDVEKQLGNILIKCSFEIAKPCITAICGCSGAGKTSIINMAAGLITPDKGIISYNGREFYNSEKKINIPANKRFTGCVFQESRLFPNMKVKKNLLYGMMRKSPSSLNCNLDDVCSLLGISHLLERYPQNLSGGEKQRVCHYYFIDKNSLFPMKWTTYYDNNGNKVNKNDPNVARVYEQIRYLAIGDSENRLMMRTDKNLIDGSISINYVDFNTDYTWEEEIPIEFGIFRNPDDIIPKDKQKEKYSKQDLQEVLEILNDLDYEIFPSPTLTLNPN